MGYPKQMYKGSYTPSAINAEQQVALDEKDEKAARKAGFIDGHEFFSKPPAGPLAEAKAAMQQMEARVVASSGKFDTTLALGK